jgi:hypothetical protein
MIEATKSRYFQSIGYYPAEKTYSVKFSNAVVDTGFSYDVRKRKVQSRGAGWIRDSVFNP